MMIMCLSSASADFKFECVESALSGFGLRPGRPSVLKPGPTQLTPVCKYQVHKTNFLSSQMLQLKKDLREPCCYETNRKSIPISCLSAPQADEPSISNLRRMLIYVHEVASTPDANDFRTELIRVESRPERGSFPLDHDAECKHLISSYLRCLKQPRPSLDNGKIQAGINDEECRLIAKDYLQCRMDKNLMAKDEMKNLGLEFASQLDGRSDQKTA
jgi:cytochrome c oxidase assembly protein subunit 19